MGLFCGCFLQQQIFFLNPVNTKCVCVCSTMTSQRRLESSLHVADYLHPNLVGDVAVWAQEFLGDTHTHTHTNTCQSFWRKGIWLAETCFGGVAWLLSDKQQQRDVTGGEETRENTPLLSSAAGTKAHTLVWFRMAFSFCLCMCVCLCVCVWERVVFCPYSLV